MTRVLVTGAAGFLGKYLVRALQGLEYDVVALVRTLPPVSDRAIQASAYFALSNPGLDDLVRVLEGVEVVYHLAALRPTTQVDSIRECFESNVLLSLNLLQACLSHGVKRFVYFSAGNAYSSSSNAPAVEEDAIYPTQAAPFYLGSKILAEIMVEHYRRNFGLATVSLRISSPYGIGMQANSAVMNFIRQVQLGQSLQVHDGGQYQTDFVFVQDVIDLAVMAGRTGPAGIYNVGSGVATSMDELAYLISDVFRRKLPIDILPLTTNANKGFRPLNIEKAKRTWPWTPRSLRAGLEIMKSEIEAKDCH
jgi:UDP-glucose 4-epimerase